MTEPFKHRLACPMLKAGCGTDQASVEKKPALRRDCRRPVRQSHLDRATKKGCRVHPRQRHAVVRQLVLDDPPSGLFHDSVAASAKFGEQCRFTTA
jgi:succinate dehydrogenase/fumarate reductase-like Fe-S protein